MIMIDFINDLHDKGILQKLFHVNCISAKLLYYRDIYLEYDIKIKMKENKTDAIFLVSEKFKVVEQTIYRIIKFMEKEV
jgi:hypothetical protein